MSATDTRADASTPTDETTGTEPGNNLFLRLSTHIKSNLVDTVLWCTRLATMFFTINFFIPMITPSVSAYNKALLSNAATSALRLHQRMPQVALSWQFFGRVIMEDSAHYLFFSIIFLSAHPMTIILVPVFLFALLHAQNYTKQLLLVIGPTSLNFVRNLLNKLSENQHNILRFIAINEIFLMPATVFMILNGYGSLLLPFVYYRFLCLRYQSQRNPYCRQVFYELRVTATHYSSQPSCPGILSKLINKVIEFTLRIAPSVPSNPQQ